MAGKLVNPNSKLQCIISKLDKYAEENENPFCEAKRFSDTELAVYLVEKYPDKIVEKIFEHYAINCVNMHKLEAEQFDKLAEELNEEGSNKVQKAAEMIALVRSVSATKIESIPIVEYIKKLVMEDKHNELSAEDMAQRLGISKYYMIHTFKKVTGTTITDYKRALRITCAKRLLVESDKSMTQIAHECGFGSPSYFSKEFMLSEHVSPSAYRHMLAKGKKPADVLQKITG